MKKLLMVLAAIFAAFTFNSCEPVVSGDFTYVIKPIDDTGVGATMTWHLAPLGETLVNEEVAKVARKINNTKAWTISGYKSDCDRLIKTALDNAMTKAESDPTYNKVIVLGGITLVVFCDTDSDGQTSSSTETYEIYRRTYNTKR